MCTSMRSGARRCTTSTWRSGASLDRFGGWWRPWNYGDHVREYWAVREAVSLGDVSTLGKMIVSGPDTVEALERLYPCNVHDIRPGRSRYALLLNERGHIIDDGMICRETDTRFVLTFTSGGASFAEMWMRDWIETWGLDVHILDRTLSLAAINVTGPLAGRTAAARRVGRAADDAAACSRRGRRCAVPRDATVVHRRGELRAAPLDRPRRRAVARADAAWAPTSASCPHGLQALFGLRLEKGHFMVGLDSEMDSTPRRLNLEWAVKMDKADFVGRAALARIAPI